MSVKHLMFPAFCFALGILLAAWDPRVPTLASTNQNQPDTHARSAAAQLEAAKAVYERYKARMKPEFGPLDRRGGWP